MRSSMLAHLLALSENHLDAALEGRWADWEKITAQKQALYRQMARIGALTPDMEQRRTMKEIQILESRTLDALKEKQEETRGELARIRRSRTVAQTYGADNGTGSRRHFGISC